MFQIIHLKAKKWNTGILDWQFLYYWT